MIWKLKKSSLLNLISTESILGEHIIQTCGQRACVCACVSFYYWKLNEWSASENGGKTKKQKKPKYNYSIEIPLFGVTSKLPPDSDLIQLNYPDILKVTV